MSNEEQNGNFAKPMLPAVFLDGNGIELKKGDKVNMTI